jgi:transcriptional antiterminator NusG
MHWYVIFVETGSEDNVLQFLHYFVPNIQALIPKRVIPEKKGGEFKKVLKNLFPGYILIHTQLNDETYHKLIHIPHLIRILGYDTYYSPIDEAEIAIILKLVNHEGIIDNSKVFIENSVVEVIEGPLKGLEGLIVRVNKHTRRVKIKLYFMGEARVIEVGIEILQTR